MEENSQGQKKKKRWDTISLCHNTLQGKVQRILILKSVCERITTYRLAEVVLQNSQGKEFAKGWQALDFLK